jgi:hypothetical protein
VQVSFGGLSSREDNMGKDTDGKPKKKCCRKYQKKSEYCKRCPVKIRLQCQLERRTTEMSKKKDEKKKEAKKVEKKLAKKKEEKKACDKKACKKKSAKKDSKKKAGKKKNKKK